MKKPKPTKKAPRRNPETPEAAARLALQKAEAWYGKESLVTEPRPLRAYVPPTAAVEVGTIVAIEYESRKYDGRSRVYRHDVTCKRTLYISPDGATLIVWPPFKITKRGIEG